MVSVGFVGTGINRIHMKWISQNADARIKAIASTHKDQLAEFSALYHATPYEDYREMLDKEQLECIYLAVPPHVHGTIDLDVLDKGVPVFIEKPVALDVTLAGKILEKIKRNNVMTSVGYQWRYYMTGETIRDLVRSSRVGMAEGRFWWPGIVEVSWWKRRNQGGGIAVEMSTHLYDLARYFFGEVDRVYCESELNLRPDHDKEIDIDDSIVSTLHFERGTVATISNTYHASTMDISLTIITDRGTVHYDEIEHVEKVHATMCSGKDCREIRESVNPYQQAADTFIKAVETKDRSIVRSPYEDALKTLAVTCALNISAKEKRPVDPRTLWAPFVA